MFCYIVISCALLGQVLSQTSLSASDEQTLLDEHNRLRGIVSPAAANMQEMAWNDTLAQVAQNYADNCSFEQSVFTSVDENLNASNGSADYASAVISWYNETSHYNFNSSNCSAVCGNYTQVVWATSNSVGCGTNRCSNLAGVQNGNNSLILVCNYGPAGNVVGKQPYMAGLSCSQCPSERSICMNNLCSASNTNAGATDAATGASPGATNAGATSAINATIGYFMMLFTAFSVCTLILRFD